MLLTPLLDPYDIVLLDLDGCVWVGEEAVEGSVAAVSALRTAGKRIAFVTNDGRHSGEEFVRKLWKLGIQASLSEVVTVGGALQHLLAERYADGASAFVIGSPAVVRHVADAGLRVVNGSDLASRASVCIVSGHESFDYQQLRCATQSLLRGAELIATSAEETYPQADGLWPGTGSILAAVETASATKAVRVIGKPSPHLFETALDRLGPGRALVVGDRLDTDLAGAHAAGLDGAIVLSGGTDARSASEADPAPVAVAATLADLVLLTPR